MLIEFFDITVYQLRKMITKKKNITKCIQQQMAVFFCSQMITKCILLFTMMIMKFILLRVEAAFHKFDTDGDGFIDWEEFKQVDFR